MDDLPNEILIRILGEVIHDSSPTSMLTVCKLWYYIAVPTLYRHIAFTEHGELEDFLRCANITRYGGYIRSLTIRMSNKSVEELRDTLGVQSPFMPPLTQLVSILPALSGLISYSMCATADMRAVLPRRLLIDIINALPDSCVNLELDTHGHDIRPPDEQLHVCDSIRHVLPRMKTVRVRLAAMCSSMFGTGKTLHATEDWPASNDDEGEFSPIETTLLHSFVVNCMHLSGRTLQRCGQEDSEPWIGLGEFSYPSPWESITSGMEQLVMKNPRTLQKARIYAISCPSQRFVLRNPVDLKTLVRADIVAKETWAIPHEVIIHENLTNHMTGPSAFRLPDGREMTASLNVIVEHTECAQWETMGNGSRLPRNARGQSNDAAASADFDLPVKTSSEWLAENPTGTVGRWLREAMVGMKLFGAEHRVGEDHLSLRIIKEITPEGWIRRPSGELVEVD